MADESEQTIAHGQVHEIYANGLSVGITNADMAVIFLLNNAPSVKVNLSYTTAKTLKNMLDEAVARLEKVTGRTIMTTDEVATGLQTLIDVDDAGGTS